MNTGNVRIFAFFGAALVASTTHADCVKERFLYAKEALILADRTHVGASVIGSGSYVEAGVNSRLHTNVTGNYIQLRNHALLNGTAHAWGVGKQAGAMVTGPNQNPLAGCDEPAVPTVSPGSADITVTSRLVLHPGNYADVSVGVDAELVLLGGDYHFASLTFQPDARLLADWQNGPARVYTNALSFGDRHTQRTRKPQSLSAMTSALEIYTSQNYYLRIGTDSYIEASIVAPAADMGVASRTTLTAPLYARTIIVEPDVTIGNYTDITVNICGGG